MSFNPQTPQSPSQLSPGSSDPATSAMTVTSSMTSVNTLPTPAHSVNGSSGALPSDMMAHDAGAATGPGPHIASAGNSPPYHKRKRTPEDVGCDGACDQREPKKPCLEDRKVAGIEDLHLDVGEKYLVCKTPCAPPRPKISDDLFEMYGLAGLAAEVARVLPNGEKNAIRKTYKGHIKKLGVNGKFDSVEEDENREEGFLSIVLRPDEDFHSLYGRGKEIDRGLNQEGRDKLLRAVTMGKGIVPKSLWDSTVLGELAPGAKKHHVGASARPTAPSTPLLTPGVGGELRAKAMQTSAAAAAQEANRPRRNIKKRGYGENSFEGYGEGFPDDAEIGYSTGGDGDVASGQKRRKKTHHAGGQPPFSAQARPQGFSPRVGGA